MKKCLILSLIIIFAINLNQLNCEELSKQEKEKIAKILDLYPLLDEENKILKAENELLKKEIKKQNNWWQENKFYIGFGCGVVFTFGLTYLSVYILQSIK